MSPGDWQSIGTIASPILVYWLAVRSSTKALGVHEEKVRTVERELERQAKKIDSLLPEFKAFFEEKFTVLTEKLDAEREHHKSLGKAIRGIDNDPPLVMHRSECMVKWDMFKKEFNVLEACVKRVEALADRNKEHASKGREQTEKSILYIKNELRALDTLTADVKNLNDKCNKVDVLFKRTGDLMRELTQLQAKVKENTKGGIHESSTC